MAAIINILAPTDFSPAAERATRRAASLASMLGGKLHLAHVLPPQEVLEHIFPAPSQSEINAIRTRAEQALQDRAQRIATQFAVSAVCHLFHGRAHQAILTATETLSAHLVVLGTQGEREGALPSDRVGDTALKVAERSGMATLFVRREAHVPYDHVMGCVNGMPADRAVIAWADTLSPQHLIHLVSVYTVAYERRLMEWGASQATIEVYATRERDKRTRQLSELLREIELPAARARLHLERGEPLQTILRIAAQWETELIVVGRRAQITPVTAGSFESIARQLAVLAPSDVLIVSPSAHPPKD